MSVHAAATMLLALTLFTGCGVIWDGALDTVVYFNNTTDQTLYVRTRSEPEVKDEYFRIEPLTTTQLRLVGRDKCTELVVITDTDGTTVKDPGKVCWHDTVTIP